MRKSWKIILVLVFVLLLIGGWKLTRNQVDPQWKALRNIEIDKIETLKKAEGKIQKLYEDFHEKESVSDTAINLISRPFLPTMEYKKFAKYVKALQNEKRIIISSVTGAGASTLIDRLAKFVATKEQNILSIRCAPQFDLIYHDKYIGKETTDGFQAGLLLKFWEKCLEHPEEKFIAIIDDFDKINPETLFGPYLWEKLSDNKNHVILGKKEIEIPANFYMVSSTLSGIGSRIKLHNEHFKRLGKKYFLAPNTIELALYLNDKKQKLLRKEKEGVLEEKDAADLSILKDKEKVFTFLYFFKKSNELISQKYSKGYQLAQWNNLRKLYQPKKRQEVKAIFISQVNAIATENSMTQKDFEPIEYSISNHGLQMGSSPLARGFKIFKDWGFLTEFVVALCFALATALLSIYLNGKRKRKITRFLAKSELIYNDFENQKIGTNEAIDKLVSLKKEIEEFTKGNKINFTEAVFFYNSINDKVNTIEITKNINSTFLMLMDVFLEDDLLTHSEYEKLQLFLDKIERNLPKQEIIKMRKKVEKVWREYGEKSNV